MGIPLYVAFCFCLAAFNIFSLYLIVKIKKNLDHNQSVVIKIQWVDLC